MSAGTGKRSDIRPCRNSLPFRAGCGTATLLLSVYMASCGVGPCTPAGQPVHPAQIPLRLDPNRASAAELALLPRIGPKLAAAIIAHRQTARDAPAFRRPEDLDCVARIGPATVELLRPYLRFPDAAAP